MRLTPKKVNAAFEYMCKLKYKEKPVCFKEFLTNTYYLGKFTSEMKIIYPEWIPTLETIDATPKRHFVVMKCSKGLGTSFITYGCCLPYILYEISCLRDPWKFFNIAGSGKLEVVFFNAAPVLYKFKGFSYLQNAIGTSPWFLKKGGGAITTENDSYMELPLFKWTHVSPNMNGEAVIGNNVIAGVIDNTGTTDSYDPAKQMIVDTFDNTVRRTKEGLRESAIIGKMFVIAPKHDSLVFLFGMAANKKILYIQKLAQDIIPEKYINRMNEDIIPSVPAKKEEPIQQPNPVDQKKEKPDIIGSMLFPKAERGARLMIALKKLREKNAQDDIIRL